MWQGAYVQTVEADLERQNGELLQENKQLKEQLKQAVAAAERAGESPRVIFEYLSVASIAEACCWFASLQMQPLCEQCHLASSGGNHMLHACQKFFASQYAVYDRQRRVCSLDSCTVSPVSNGNDKIGFALVEAVFLVNMC